jgi:hypothetical protein
MNDTIFFGLFLRLWSNIRLKTFPEVGAFWAKLVKSFTGGFTFLIFTSLQNSPTKKYLKADKNTL